MSTPVDSNILPRLIDITAPTHATTRQAVAKVCAGSEGLFLVPQNLYTSTGWSRPGRLR